MNIVLLHGLTGSKRYFDGLMAQLKNYPDTEVFAFDLLGFGTDYKNTASQFTLEEHLAHISTQIDQAFPEQPVVLLGHSLGGVLSLAWAKEHPNRVQKIILLNTPLANTPAEAYQSILDTDHKLTSWSYLIEKARPLAFVSCKILCSLDTMKYFEGLRPDYVPHAVFEDYRRHSWKSLTHTLEKVFLRVPAGMLLASMSDIPILIISGESDSAIMRRHPDGPNITNIELTGGHQLLLEDPTAVTSAIHKFLSN